MGKFTITQLKKELEQKTKAELIQEIATLCQTFPQVKDYYKMQGSDIVEVIKKYKDIIEKEFIEGKTRGLPKARLSVARKALKDFKKFTKEPKYVADIMLTYVESVSWFDTEYGPNTEEFYTSPENLFGKVLKLLKQHHLLGEFKLRAHRIVKRAADGWGHRDTLKEHYEEVYGEFIE